MVPLLGLKSSIVAPLTIGDETIGALAVSGQDLTEDDVPIITAFANQASIALENARLVAEVGRAARTWRNFAPALQAQEEERRRMSLELHDELGQALTGIGFDLAAIERRVAAGGRPRGQARLARSALFLPRWTNR